jgi:transcriptional regulator with XRE-family HTH domain
MKGKRQETFAERLALQRQWHEMTLRDVAEEIGVTSKTVWNYETGLSEPTLSTLPKLAKLFKCSVQYLVTGDNRIR